MKKRNLSLYDPLLHYKPTNLKRKTFRSTQIIAAIDPAATQEQVISMIEAGMNIASFSIAKGENEKIIEAPLRVLREALNEYNITRCREAEQQAKQGGATGPVECPIVHIGTAMDVKGASIKTGSFQSLCILPDGHEVNLTNDEKEETNSSATLIYVNFLDLMFLAPGQRILINGEIRFEVARADEDKNILVCNIIKGGELKPGMSHEVNIHGATFEIGSTPDEMLKLAAFCKKNDIDMIFTPIDNHTSFKKMKILANSENPGKYLQVVAKLEGQEAAEQVDKIIVEQADGIIISRIRLGRVLLTPEQVIVYQKNILAKCLRAGVPSIVSNNILKSMEDNFEGTRAELTDIAHSVLDGVDCIKLDDSVSTDAAVQALSKIIMEAEDMVNYRRRHRNVMSQVLVTPSPIISYNFNDTIAVAACTTAVFNEASAIVVVAFLGKVVRLVAKYRPPCPIIAVARKPSIARQCLLSRGVFAIVSGEENPENYLKSVEERILSGISYAKVCGMVKKLSDTVVVVYCSKDGKGKFDTIRVDLVDKEKKPDCEVEEV